MTRQVPDCVWKVYLALQAHGAREALQPLTATTLTATTHLTRKSVQRGLLWLEKDGRIEIARSAGKNPNRYRVVRSNKETP